MLIQFYVAMWHYEATLITLKVRRLLLILNYILFVFDGRIWYFLKSNMKGIWVDHLAEYCIICYPNVDAVQTPFHNLSISYQIYGLWHMITTL